MLELPGGCGCELQGPQQDLKTIRGGSYMNHSPCTTTASRLVQLEPADTDFDAFIRRNTLVARSEPVSLVGDATVETAPSSLEQKSSVSTWAWFSLRVESYDLVPAMFIRWAILSPGPSDMPSQVKRAAQDQSMCPSRHRYTLHTMAQSGDGIDHPNG